MMKRYLALAGLVAGLGCVVMVILAMLPPRPGVTRSNLDRVEVGMKWKDVEAVFGPGSARVVVLSSGGSVHISGDSDAKHGFDLHFGAEGGVAGLKGDDGTASITFDDGMCVVSKEWIDSPRSVFQKLRQLLDFSKR
jgi:hypothetical protein